MQLLTRKIECNRLLLDIVLAALLFWVFLAVGKYRLSESPSWLNQDEASFAAGALSLAQTGKDLCGSHLPLFVCQLHSWPFKGVSTSYYLSAIFYWVYHPEGVYDTRLFSVIIGALSGSLFFILLRRIFSAPLYLSLFFAVAYYFSPGVFVLQRFGAPYYVLPLMLQLLLFSLVFAFDQRRSPILFFFIFLLATLLLFDYQPYRLLAPLYFFLFLWLYRKDIGWKQFWFGFLSFLLFTGIVGLRIVKDPFSREYIKSPVLYAPYLAPLFYVYYLSYLFWGFSFSHYVNIAAGLVPKTFALFLAGGFSSLLGKLRGGKFYIFMVLALAISPIPAVFTNPSLLPGSVVANRFLGLIPGVFLISLLAFLWLKENSIMAGISKKFRYGYILLPVLIFLTFVEEFFYVRNYFGYWDKTVICDFSRGYGCNYLGLFNVLRSRYSNRTIMFDSRIVLVEGYIAYFSKVEGINLKASVFDISKDEIPHLTAKDILVTTKNLTLPNYFDDTRLTLLEEVKESNTSETYFEIFGVT